MRMILSTQLLSQASGPKVPAACVESSPCQVAMFGLINEPVDWWGAGLGI